MTWTAVAPGTAGNGIAIQLFTQAPTPSQPISITVAGSTIIIGLGTDGAGVANSTFATISAALNANAAAAALVTTTISGAFPNTLFKATYFGELQGILSGGGGSAFTFEINFEGIEVIR
jgi:hypothetical protein